METRDANRRATRWPTALSAQRGFTLVEIAIVVAIAAIMIAISIQIVPQVIVQNRVNAEAQELPGIVSKIQKIYSDRTSFAGINTPTLAALNAFPRERLSGPDVINRWGGTITVTTSIAADILTLTYTNIPQEDCIELVQAVGAMPRSITVQGMLIKPRGGMVDLNLLPAGCKFAPTAIVAYEFEK